MLMRRVNKDVLKRGRARLAPGSQGHAFGGLCKDTQAGCMCDTVL